jgi:hypothetical protein
MNTIVDRVTQEAVGAVSEEASIRSRLQQSVWQLINERGERSPSSCYFVIASRGEFNNSTADVTEHLCELL